MDTAIKEYERWLHFAQMDPELKRMLETIAGDEAELTDCFYQDLSFGTGGLRGKIGAGTNRMNIYTVGRTTQGLAEYLKDRSPQPTACIAYDTRNFSLEFAQTAAGVLCANGLKVFLFETVHPTPMLSFAVRHLGASCGIVITASHNPKEYNGYKVYNGEGGQFTDAAAAEILEHINACDIFEDVMLLPLDKALASGNLEVIGEAVDSVYYEKVKNLILRKSMVRTGAAELKVIYSPLHGSGNIPVRRVLGDLGFTNLTVVPEQELPDGNFPTAPYPNPEDISVFALAKALAADLDPDLIFATDPDCDRIGLLAKDDRGIYSVLTGNQTGALLCDYTLTTMQELDILPENAAVIKTIVSTDLADRICSENGVFVADVLTGFKYIGEKIGAWEADKSHSFVFGFEESYGYLAGDFVRDKDAVIAAALVSEMALYYKKNGLTLYQAMQRLYERYGQIHEKTVSYAMPGKDGQARIAEIMERLRGQYQNSFAGETLCLFEDYLTSVRENPQTGAREPILLPKSNVLKFIFTNNSWLVLRPSGTEPKIKLYLSASGDTAEAAEARIAALEGLANGLFL